MVNITIYGLLGAITILLLIIASRKKVASFRDFVSGVNSSNNTIKGDLFKIISNIFRFIFLNRTILFISFLVLCYSSIKIVSNDSSVECGKVIETKKELKSDISQKNLFILENNWVDQDGEKYAKDYDKYYYCYIYFKDKKGRIYEQNVTYNLYEEYINNPNKKYCTVIHNFEYYKYMVIIIFVSSFLIVTGIIELTRL